jgi:hypothetical protein
MLKKINLLLLSSQLLLATSFLISAGGFDVIKHKDHYSFGYNSDKNSTHAFLSEVLKKKSPNTNAVTMWITRGWKEFWYAPQDLQKNFIDKGYTPIFIFYWFGDDISVDYLQKHKQEYFKALKRFSTYLHKLHGKKIVVLNPEYNMAGVEKYKDMNQIFLQSYAILRENPQTLVGPCVGDFGNYKKIDEPKEWKLFDPSLNIAAKQADFIAFQEMRAVTRNSKGDIVRTAARAYHLAKYLHSKYKKPTLLAYAALSSYGKGGEEVQEKAYQEFVKYLPKMKKDADLIGFGIFHYFDYPGHVGYFNAAEEYFGILRKDGSKKPSFYYYNKLH